MDTLNDENVCDRLEQAILYDKKGILNMCEMRIIVNGPNIQIGWIFGMQSTSIGTRFEDERTVMFRRRSL